MSQLRFKTLSFRYPILEGILTGSLMGLLFWAVMLVLVHWVNADDMHVGQWMLGVDVLALSSGGFSLWLARRRTRDAALLNDCVMDCYDTWRKRTEEAEARSDQWKRYGENLQVQNQELLERAEKAESSLWEIGSIFNKVNVLTDAAAPKSGQEAAPNPLDEAAS